MAMLHIHMVLKASSRILSFYFVCTITLEGIILFYSYRNYGSVSDQKNEDKNTPLWDACEVNRFIQIKHLKVPGPKLNPEQAFQY